MHISHNDHTPSQYVSYLMRLWRPSATSNWHILLEHIGTGERLGFADVNALHVFLCEQTGDINIPPDSILQGEPG